jgi:hypothetical protein
MNLLFDDVDIFEDDFEILEIIDIGFPRLCCVRSAHFHDMDEFTFYWVPQNSRNNVVARC